jgi:hypothetical protein
MVSLLTKHCTHSVRAGSFQHLCTRGQAVSALVLLRAGTFCTCALEGRQFWHLYSRGQACLSLVLLRAGLFITCALEGKQFLYLCSRGQACFAHVLLRAGTFTTCALEGRQFSELRLFLCVRLSQAPTFCYQLPIWLLLTSHHLPPAPL